MEFTKDDLVRFHTTANKTPQHTFWRAYSVIASSFGSRSAEPHNLLFENVTRLIDSQDGSVSYRVRFKRSKSRGKKSKGADSFAEKTGQYEIAALEDYFACFSDPPRKAKNCADNGRSGRFFRYLEVDRLTKKIVSTIKPIGKIPCSSVGKEIATFLARWPRELHRSVLERNRCDLLCGQRHVGPTDLCSDRAQEREVHASLCR
jgi:hypothetical protein